MEADKNKIEDLNNMINKYMCSWTHIPNTHNIAPQTKKEWCRYGTYTKVLKKNEIIQNVFSDHTGNKLGISNRDIMKISTYLEIRQHNSK